MREVNQDNLPSRRVTCGVANHLARRTPRLGSPDFGKSFDHYVLMELRGYQVYRQPDLGIAFWRTASGYEVDFVLDDMRLAVEVKASKRVHDGDLGGLRALGEEHRVRHRVVVCLEDEPRRLADGIEVPSWREFLDRLWEGDLGV